MRLEAYPRLVPWELEGPAEMDTTVLRLDAMSYALQPPQRGSRTGEGDF